MLSYNLLSGSKFTRAKKAYFTCLMSSSHQRDDRKIIHHQKGKRFKLLAQAIDTISSTGDYLQEYVMNLKIKRWLSTQPLRRRRLVVV
jgi:hypothetical protein